MKSNEPPATKTVLLVNTNTEKAPYPVPPVGLALLASRLETRYRVHLFDGAFGERAELVRCLEELDPDYVGLGIRNVDDVVMGSGVFYIDTIGERFVEPIRDSSNAVVVLGGGGFSIFPDELLRRYEVDYGVVGEGESAFPALLEALDEGRDPAGIPGVVTRARGTDGAKRTAPKGGALAQAPALIDRWIDYAPYRSRGSYPVQSKRGCAHRCAYCSYPAIEGRAYRLRPPAEVVDEIVSARERLGDVSIEIVDSTFNDPPGHAEAICREIVDRGLAVRLRTMGVNPGGLSGELLALMKRAGFAQIDCTPDSASPPVLAALGKNFDRPTLEKAAGLIATHKMPCMWFFLFGGPGEDEETIAETFDFVDRFVDRRDMVHMTAGLRVFPGTRLHEVALAEDLVAPDDSLLEPRFYVSPALGPERLVAILKREASTRPNCIPADESTPDPEMIREALALREREGLDEPMFRTLLRIRSRRILP